MIRFVIATPSENRILDAMAMKPKPKPPVKPISKPKGKKGC